MAEPGYQTVKDLLEAAEQEATRVFVSQWSLVELAHAIAHSHGEDSARDDLRLVLEMPVEFQGTTNDQCLRAGLLRSRHRLSTVDAVIVIQAMDAGATLVHKDPEFESIKDLDQIRLPYKTVGTGTPHRKK
jgi:predicted nucleic acid-binding protein